jgi:hypothetical protein
MVLLWGSTWAAIKIGVAQVPPYVFAFERAIAVASLLTIAVLVLRQSFPRTRAALAASAVSGFFNIGTSWALIFWAEQFVPSGLVAVFGAMAPVWTAILAHFFVHGDRLSRLKVVALVLGLVGTALLVGAPAPSEGPNALLATALLAIMPISWAIAAILITRFLSRESPIAVVGIGTWVSAAFLLPFALTEAGQPRLVHRPRPERVALPKASPDHGHPLAGAHPHPGAAHRHPRPGRRVHPADARGRRARGECGRAEREVRRDRRNRRNQRGRPRRHRGGLTVTTGR